LGTRVLGHYIVIYWYWRICFKKKNDIWTPIAFKKRYWTPASSLPLFIELFEWLFTLGIVFSCSYIVQVYQLRHCHHLVEIHFFISLFLTGMTYVAVLGYGHSPVGWPLCCINSLAKEWTSYPEHRAFAWRTCKAWSLACFHPCI
jgi:hypothetical protein